MKIRNGFVSNSSSSSFVLDKTKVKLKKSQINAIKQHTGIDINKFNGEHGASRFLPDVSWEIKEEGNFIIGYTSMDNFCMKSFMNDIGVSIEKCSQWWHSNEQNFKNWEQVEDWQKRIVREMSE